MIFQFLSLVNDKWILRLNRELLIVANTVPVSLQAALIGQMKFFWQLSVAFNLDWWPIIKQCFSHITEINLLFFLLKYYHSVQHCFI